MSQPPGAGGRSDAGSLSEVDQPDRGGGTRESPMVCTNSPMLCFWCVKTCSTVARVADLPVLDRAVRREFKQVHGAHLQYLFIQLVRKKLSG